jgi:pimeloyl-ACP methyl ester carboxylesterase
VRGLGAIAVVALFAPGAASAVVRPLQYHSGGTRIRVITYVAHDGLRRRAWLALPADYDGAPIPLVISPHGRGVDARDNARLWGNLPGLGDFAVINPVGQGRKLTLYSWGDPGEIADLARMPKIVEAHGVNVDPKRIYAFGGSMGGQEVLLLDARYPHLLAGAAAFDPATDMARRYWDFSKLPGGGELQRLAREEIGGTPLTDPRAYAARSPDTFARQIALFGVPLQLYWSNRDHVISDQIDETGVLNTEIHGWDPYARVWTFRGDWAHTAEMRPWGRLPRALARFGLLPWNDAPLPGTRSEPVPLET